MMNGWHLKREISIGHLLTTIALAAAAFAGFFNLKENIRANTERGLRHEMAIVKLIDADTSHASLPIHPGARADVAKLTAEIRSLTRQVSALDLRVQRQWDAFNAEFRRRDPE